jgi:hypothetical protein
VRFFFEAALPAVLDPSLLPFRTMERREPRASRSGAWQPRRLAGWQLWELARVASQARAAGDRAVKMHGVVIFFRHPEGTQQGCGQQRTSAVVDDAPTASSAKPAQLSKRKQRSAARLEVFQRQAAATAAAAAVSDARAGAASAVEAAARRWLARRHVARLRAAVPPPLESGAVAPSAAHWENISLIYLKYMSDCLIWPYQALIRLIF